MHFKVKVEKLQVFNETHYQVVLTNSSRPADAEIWSQIGLQVPYTSANKAYVEQEAKNWAQFLGTTVE